MKIFTRIFIVFIVISFWNEINIKAQAFQATYINDANGNRIKATVIYLTTSIQSKTLPLDTLVKKDSLSQVNISKLPDDGWTNPKIDSSATAIISIYPNPTHGLLYIEISGVNNDQIKSTNNAITLWNIQGKETLTITPNSSSNTVDMSALPSGVYIINVYLSGKSNYYKIIKD